jgi:hypothetical protein
VTAEAEAVLERHIYVHPPRLVRYIV